MWRGLGFCLLDFEPSEGAFANIPCFLRPGNDYNVVTNSLVCRFCQACLIQQLFIPYPTSGQPLFIFLLFNVDGLF